LSHDPVFAFDNLRRWPPDARTLMVDGLRLLRKAEPATHVTCDSCVAGHVIDVDVREYASGTIGVAHCPECGRVSVPLERLSQWRLDLNELASRLAKTVEARGTPTIEKPDRLALVGTVKVNGSVRDVFLMRGITWPDSITTLEGSRRLNQASRPIVFTFTGPAGDGMPVSCTIVPLLDYVSIESRRIVVDPISLERTPGADAPGDSDVSALPDIDRAVVTYLSEHPHESRLITDIVAGAGYSATPTKDAIKRLTDLGLIGRPHGTKRQGLALTNRGRRLLTQLC
jgi:predicted transcriptional regulator